MATVTLEAQPRTKLGSPEARRSRIEGKVPAIVYGHGTNNISVTVNARELNRILSSDSGSNTLITLDIAGNKDTTLARQIHRHPTKPFIYHVDFIRVNVNEEVEAEVTIHLEGDAEGTKNGGRLEQMAFSLTIKAKPNEIPTALTHDVTALEIGDQVQVKDIVLPSGVTTEVDPEEVVATVAVPKVEAEPEVAVEGDEGGEASAEGGDAKASDGESKDS